MDYNIDFLPIITKKDYINNNINNMSIDELSNELIYFENFDKSMQNISRKIDTVRNRCVIIFKKIHNKIKDEQFKLHLNSIQFDNKIIYTQNLDNINSILVDLENNMLKMNQDKLKEYYIWLKDIDKELKTANNKICYLKPHMFGFLSMRIDDLKKEVIMNKQYDSIIDMINKVTSRDQRHILERITSDSEYSKIYLSKCQPYNNTKVTKKNKNLFFIVNVLGAYNKRKQMREEYEIKIFKVQTTLTNNNESKMFTCSCPDFKFNCKYKNIVCKHICFLICKVGKIFKPYFYENNILNEDDFNVLIIKLTNENTWTAAAITKNIEKITMELFKQFTKPIADSCPICFNDLTENDKHIILSCPCCKNYVHTECIEVWMEKKMECVFCRSDCWDKYVSIKN